MLTTTAFVIALALCVSLLLIVLNTLNFQRFKKPMRYNLPVNNVARPEASELIDRELELKHDLPEGVGSVHVDGKLWKVRSDMPLIKGSNVRVTDREGDVLIIQPNRFDPAMLGKSTNVTVEGVGAAGAMGALAGIIHQDDIDVADDSGDAVEEVEPVKELTDEEKAMLEQNQAEIEADLAQFEKEKQMDAMKINNALPEGHVVEAKSREDGLQTELELET